MLAVAAFVASSPEENHISFIMLMYNTLSFSLPLLRVISFNKKKTFTFVCVAIRIKVLISVICYSKVSEKELKFICRL